ncbi:hypothetical protein G6F31_021229 [Rhizopus arrhizus]|nr:hypothetical protein G6F31_021229 [Rhizopus arrhizus]
MIPKAVNKQNVPSWSLGAYTGCLQTLSIDMANELVWRALINCEGAEITNPELAGDGVVRPGRAAGAVARRRPGPHAVG